MTDPGNSTAPFNSAPLELHKTTYATIYLHGPGKDLLPLALFPQDSAKQPNLLLWVRTLSLLTKNSYENVKQQPNFRYPDPIPRIKQHEKLSASPQDLTVTIPKEKLT